ncbi:MAG: phage portal protein [Candidatus Schekmanbacteria bacterium]|nr:MAG: phage portal protein [Candidatus Schekmanbacteria bacterium]
MAWYDRVLDRLGISKSTRQQGFSGSGQSFFTSDDANNILIGENIGAADKELWTSESATVDTLYEVLKRSPEVVGIIKVLVEDVLSDGWRFEGSASAVKRAKKAEINLNFFKVLSDALWDLFITGDAYILKLSIDRKDVARSISNKLKSKGYVFKNKKLEKEFIDGILEELPSETKGLQLLKSSTIVGDFDEYGNVRKWIQKVPGTEKTLEFSPDDVIHLSLINLGGGVYGFSPLQTLLSDIGTLLYAKESAGKVFENQGIPPVVWNLPEASGEDDRNYQVLKNQLKNIKKFKNRYSDIITTGKVETIQVRASQLNEMQFKDLIVHFTNLILFAWGVPAHRVPFIQAKTTIFPKESNDGYFKSIAYIQKLLEPQLNVGLWSEFKVSMTFNKSYRIDELREANINAILWDRGGQSIEEGRERMGLPPKIPKDHTMPHNLKQGIFTRFDENRDNRQQRGDMSDIEQDTNTPQFQDNKVR